MAENLSIYTCNLGSTTGISVWLVYTLMGWQGCPYQTEVKLYFMRMSCYCLARMATTDCIHHSPHLFRYMLWVLVLGGQLPYLTLYSNNSALITTTHDLYAISICWPDPSSGMRCNSELDYPLIACNVYPVVPLS